jgi:GTP pyrophosphokinase
MTPVKEIIAAMRNPSPEDIALVEKAYAFTEKAHMGHLRYSGEPYFIHPSATAKILAEYGMDAATIAAGLLHDTIEDARASTEAVETEFGKEVLTIVEGVTKLGHHHYHGAERHAESLRRLLVATAKDIRVLIVKLADRYHNMTTLEHVPEHKRKRIALETLDIFAPIADRLGMGKMKRDLEDLAFPFVDPDAYHHTLELRKLKRKENDAGLLKVQKELQHTLARKEFKQFHTDIRIKGLWSLHQKMKRKSDDITSIHDIAALRVVVPTVEDCYAVLGLIHSLWKPLPGEFKDYIAFPKPNGYRSLHTTVVTGEAGIVEMQVRTEEMHREAQFGIASHMSYKTLGNVGKKKFMSFSFSWFGWLIPSLLTKTPEGAEGRPASEIHPAWLTELKEAHIDSNAPDTFVDGLKEDFFSHRIFVFTPDGDVIDLPIQSTPIDFAYAIHSNVGNHTHGAKINGKLVSLETPLRNGDMVEILQRDSARPTKKWLDTVHTSLARRHIRVALGMGETQPSKKSKR